MALTLDLITGKFALPRSEQDSHHTPAPSIISYIKMVKGHLQMVVA
jgi:hypothetical protein